MHLMFNKELSATFKANLTVDEKVVVGLCLLFVVDRSMVKNRTDVPFFEVRKLDASLLHVIVSRSFAILEIHRIVDVPEGIEFVAAYDSF